MSLPPLPPAAVDEHNLQGGRLLYTHQQMKAYGQACRAQALEEAALICDGEKWHNEGKPVGYITAFNDGCADCEAAIRRLK